MNDDEAAPGRPRTLREAIEAYYADPVQQAEHARRRAEADAARRAKDEGPPWVIVRYSPGEPAPMTCPTCGRLVAQLPVADGEVAGPVHLVAGFTNERRRHPTGLPWFVLGEPGKPSPAIRGVVVVTCWCGADCRILRTQAAFADMVGDQIRNDPSHRQHRVWAERPIDWRNRE